MIETLEIYYSNHDYISNEDIQFLNKISPKMLRIKRIKQTVENIKALASINCINIDTYFSNSLWMINSYLWFINTPIQLFDTQSGQRLTFEWKLMKFFIENNQIENVKLLKTKTGNFLFIPLDVISLISCSGSREILSADEINKQFADLEVLHHFEDKGYIIPMGYTNRIFIKLDDSELKFLNQFKNISQIFKEKHVELKIKNLGRLPEINKLLPDDFYHINFEYFYDRSKVMKEYSVSKIMENLDWVNLKFIKIFIPSKLSPNEFQFWWIILDSSKTRFNLTSVYLKFSLLSEWLTALSLCLGCSEPKYVELCYSEVDAENEHEIIEQAKIEFIHKYGFIQRLVICKY